jgi:hypothetical protein
MRGNAGVGWIRVKLLLTFLLCVGNTDRSALSGRQRDGRLLCQANGE